MFLNVMMNGKPSDQALSLGALLEQMSERDVCASIYVDLEGASEPGHAKRLRVNNALSKLSPYLEAERNGLNEEAIAGMRAHLEEIALDEN